MKLSKYGFNVALVLLLVPGIARAADPELVQLINKEASLFASTNNSGERSSGSYSPAAPERYNISGPLAFAIDYGNKGVVRGHGRCSTQDGIELTNLLDTITDETGQTGAMYCYCGLDNYTPLNGTATNLSGPWAYIGFSDESQCASNCAGLCAMQLARWYNYSSDLALQTAVFNAYVSSSKMVTTQTYVDNVLSGKQTRITQTGTNKLMTFGNGTGATPGSRDIVSTLGTSTSATTVPTVGPIVTAVNNKQDAVNGTANYVMTGTGTSGTVGEKPVYSATTNYTNALVTAQTINTAAMEAANGELTCIDNDCLLWQIRTTTPSGLSIRIDFNPDTSISGTSVCWRNLSNEGNYANYDGTCSASTLSYIGASGSKSGKWGTVFSYGDVSGISVCSSTTKNSVGTIVATDAQAAVLDSEYLAQTGIGLGDTELNTNYHCWCKMENPGTSKWIYVRTVNYGGSVGARCSDICVNDCARDVRDNSSGNFRTTMYGTIN